jgi:hypothetical protein
MYETNAQNKNAVADLIETLKYNYDRIKESVREARKTDFLLKLQNGDKRAVNAMVLATAADHNYLLKRQN